VIHRLLPLPQVLERVAGGSLLGFIAVRGVLWPLVRLVEFEHFIAAPSREAA
jgi:hypothetical protein